MRARAKQAFTMRSAEVAKNMLNLKALPVEVQLFGKWMIEQAAKELGPRDIIKAFLITRSSVIRQAISGAKLRRTWPGHPWKDTDLIRPEDAFAAMLLQTYPGKQYLDSAEEGLFDEAAARALAYQSSAFGLGGVEDWWAPWRPTKEGEHRGWPHAASNISWPGEPAPNPHIGPVPQWAADRNESGVRSTASSGMYFDLYRAVVLGKHAKWLIHILREGSDKAWVNVVEQWVEGISVGKAGFLAALLGRGTIPTGDAREVLYWVKSGRDPQGDANQMRYFVSNLADRLKALNVPVPPDLAPFYQHLVHHAVWDRLSKTGKVLLEPGHTTHEELMQAMSLAGLD